MEKYDKLILKAFLVSIVPKDFNETTNRMLMVEAIIGLADRVYHGEKLLRNEVQRYDLDKESKKEIEIYLFIITILTVLTFGIS